jgi:hypothetical protein
MSSLRAERTKRKKWYYLKAGAHSAWSLLGTAIAMGTTPLSSPLISAGASRATGAHAAHCCHCQWLIADSSPCQNLRCYWSLGWLVAIRGSLLVPKAWCLSDIVQSSNNLPWKGVNYKSTVKGVWEIQFVELHWPQKGEKYAGYARR